MKITGFLVLDGDGRELPADPYGTNLAFCCLSCGHPLLAVALENQRGSDEQHPAVCKRCQAAFFLDVRPQSEKLYIHFIQRAASL